MELIKKYFPELNSVQLSQFENLYKLYSGWNQKINLISRKDLDRLLRKACIAFPVNCPLHPFRKSR